MLSYNSSIKLPAAASVKDALSNTPGLTLLGTPAPTTPASVATPAIVPPVNAQKTQTASAIQSLAFHWIDGNGAKQKLDIKPGDPRLEIANQIKAASDAINPTYTPYLLRLALQEGAYQSDARNYNYTDNTKINPKTGKLGANESTQNLAIAQQHPGYSTDRGIFQYNDKYHPDISTSTADNVAAAVALAQKDIAAGKQSQWASNGKVKNTQLYVNGNLVKPNTNLGI